MQSLIIQTEKFNEVANTQIVHFNGDFDGYVKENLTEILKLIEDGEAKTRLIFDFSKLNYLNSYAIGHLVAWHNKLTESEGEIIIVGINKNIEDIFSILGVNSLFKTFPDLEAAKEQVKMM